jgi:transcriptional regulator with XRE-family HTH domain
MIGQRIRELRKRHYWTQKDLGEKAGIEPKNIGGYESGRLKPSRKTLEKFAQALGVSLEDLIASETQMEGSGEPDDQEILELVREMHKLPESEKVHLKWMISVALRQHKIQAAMVS